LALILLHRSRTITGDTLVTAESPEEWMPYHSFVQNNTALPIPTQSPQQAYVHQNLKEYKILTQKDKWFGGKFDPELLEKAVNAYAKHGWRVISCATAQIPGFAGNREEMMIVLERDKS
jgi:hypothetical protein